MKSIWCLVLAFVSLSASARDFRDCHIIYDGCMDTNAKCAALLKDEPQLLAAIEKAYLHAKSSTVLINCKNWKRWLPVDSVAEINAQAQFKEIFNHSAKHWYINELGRTLGAFSLDQLKALKAGKIVRGAEGVQLNLRTAVWSGVRMGKNASFTNAGSVDELVFNVFEAENSTDKPEDPFNQKE